MSPRESAYQVREACRFHRTLDTGRGSMSARNLAPAGQGTGQAVRPAAGASMMLQKRRDVPPDGAGARGRARSLTPEYHNRYARNTLGTSLPGAGPAPPEPPPSPLGHRRASARGLGEPPLLTSSRHVQAACHFHMAAESPRRPCRTPSTSRTLSLSSTGAKETPGLAGSLRGNGHVLQTHRAPSRKSLWY
mmetsp:Transcript_48398/g.154576  ORF Transcript_48398/g.154576 Transcript_48398/m.154576 type:complete len:191 (-) Transcript_48398:155-727(-)